VDDYKLCSLLKKRGVSSVDDLYHVLFYHWVHDNAVFWDKQQQNYVVAGILMASYFGCRPVSMFNTQLRFEEENDARKPANHAAAASRPKNGGEDQDPDKDMDWKDDRATLVKLDCDLNTNDNASTYYDCDSDSGTDDGVDAGLDETGCLLWSHIIFIIAFNRISEAPNILFAKVTLTHTKGEDNRPRE